MNPVAEIKTDFSSLPSETVTNAKELSLPLE
jgi:hypothetical protein